MRGGADHKSARDEMQSSRTARHGRGDFKTENERSFQDPENFDPTEDEYGRPIRRLYSGRIKKRVDLKHEGESDEVIYQYTGEGTPTPNKYALDEIYPEKFDDAAGQPSKTLFAKNARMKMVEYFPEKDIKAYLGGEADELMFGHSVSGYGMGNDQYEVREVPDLIPQSYMSAAGLTSKELRRNVLKEKINQDGPHPRPHVSDKADEVMYGRRTNNHGARRDKITELPLHGFGGGFREAAGLASADSAQAGEEPLELKLENKIRKETPPYLGGEADEVIYGRQMGGNRSELNEIKDLKPKKFEGAAGLTSNEVIRANPDLEHYIIEQPPGSIAKIELRRGGEMAERLGAVEGELGEPLRVASTYANEGHLAGSSSPFLGAAGMNSSDLTTKSGSADQMIFRLNPQSGLATGGEAAQAIYSQDVGHSFVHKGLFEISSIYPRAFRGVAGASSRNLFKNSPEAGGRHLFSENLKDRIVGRPGHGTDAKPKEAPGAAGLNSKNLFKGHKLQAIGDTPRHIDHDKDGDGVFDHLRDEEADIVLYGGDLPDEELRKVGGIKDRNPRAFEGAAGLTSREVFRVQQEVMTTPECDPDEHRLGQARWGGEMETTMYGDHPGNRSVEYEVQKLAPQSYKDAAGLTSKVVQAVRDEAASLDDARGKKTMPATQRAFGNPNMHTRTNPQQFDQRAYKDAAGLTSLDQHKPEDEDHAVNDNRIKGDMQGGEAAAVIFGGKPVTEKVKPKSIAGLTSTQIRAIKRSGFEARKLDVRSMKDSGGCEAHDTMYGKSEEDIEYDDDHDDLPRIHEIPEIYPETYTGAAGLASKEVFRQKAQSFMFGEKTSDGLEYGAKHIADLAAPPNASQLNQAFMQSSHWFEPDDSLRPPTQQEVEQAAHAHAQAEEARQHALYQSYASYGSEHPPDEYGATETGGAHYQGSYASEAAGGTYTGPGHGGAGGGGAMHGGHGGSPSHQESAPRWGQRGEGGGPQQAQPPTPPRSRSPQRPGSAPSHPSEQQRERVPGGPPNASPMDRIPPGQQHRMNMDRMRAPQSGGGGGGGGGSDSQRSTPRRSTPGLFEKGSFAARKIEDVGRAFAGDSPLSGRSTPRGSMGGYADFAARMRGAESNRSARSARSYRG